jgi:hypothetical protein
MAAGQKALIGVKVTVRRRNERGEVVESEQRPGVAICGRYGVPDEVARLEVSNVGDGEDAKRRATVKGVQFCGMGSCVLCGPRRAGKRAQELAYCVAKSGEAGLGVFHVTFTIRHHRRGAGHLVTIKQQREAIEDGWRKMLNGRHRERLFEELRALGLDPEWTARGFEITFAADSAGTPHAHWHVLLGASEAGGRLSEEQVERVQLLLAEEWQKAVGVESTSLDRGVKVRRVDPRNAREARDIADYVAGGGWSEDEGQPLKSAAYEVAGAGHTKEARAVERWTLPQLMEEVARGNARAAASYREYVKATRGLRLLVLSKGAKPYRPASEEELAEWWGEQVEPVASDVVGEVMLPAVVLRTEGAVADLVDAVEAGASLSELERMIFGIEIAAMEAVEERQRARSA